MQSKKKMIVNTVFLVAIFALTIYGVFHGEDLGAMMEAMRRADVRWLLPGLLCVVFFIWGESIIIWYMMHSFQIPVKRRTCFPAAAPVRWGGRRCGVWCIDVRQFDLPGGFHWVLGRHGASHWVSLWRGQPQGIERPAETKSDAGRN